jgi:TolB-like protein/AraC-like DNA-binding protein
MPESPILNDFLSQLTAIVEKNISNEQFGVSELADEMNMSRSNLLRKVKKDTNLSVSQLIRNVRLTRSMELLQKTSLNVSEVSHEVGFGSTSYFIKCFREHYGFPPGEAGKKGPDEIQVATDTPSRNRSAFIIGSAVLAVVLITGLLIYFWPASRNTSLERSIAVLPFKNDSNDSTNVYLINGLMESTLNNLQKIENLKVISRTSSEKYRDQRKSIPEMAKELNTNYFVEGSGQKIGDQILLNIQLIEGPSDKHLWSKQYKREAKDIFSLQQEIAKNIADEIQVIITPEERKRIEKIPTSNLVAYDSYLKGRDLLYQSTEESLTKSIPFFKKAIEQDEKFALAYADAVIAYYYLDIFRNKKKYTREIGNYADKAWLYDPNLDESLVAKALFYMDKKEYTQAVPYLEKALEYNPNSGLAVHFLSELYNGYVPNTNKYLEYALMGVRIDGASGDSATLSFKYMHLSNALLQSGFIDEALTYVNKSLAYNPKSPFSAWVKIGILYARSKDMKQLRQSLIDEFNKDTSRFYLAQEIGKICYTMRDYPGAYHYYKRFIDARDARQMDIYKIESLNIGMVMDRLGMKEKSKAFILTFKEYADNDLSIYKNLSLTAYYAWMDDNKKALEHLALFSKEDHFQYFILFLTDDPVMDHIENLPEFKKIMTDIETKFWNNHKKIRATLEEKGLL